MNKKKNTERMNTEKDLAKLIEKINKKDFKNMMFPIFEMGPKESVLKKYPILKKNKKMSSTQFPCDPILAIRYVMFCYDKNSALQDIPDIIERKTAAMILAGFKKPKTPIPPVGTRTKHP